MEETIIEEISKELGISKELVNKIKRSQFKYVSDIMIKGEFETVKLPYFGKFTVKPYRLQKLNENYGTFYTRRQSSDNTTGVEINSIIQETDNQG